MPKSVEVPDNILSASVQDFLAATAAKCPTPGGGAVAALAGALAASLAQMALQYTIGKKKYESFRGDLVAAVEQLERATGLLTQLIDEDIAAYAGLSAFLKLPPDQRQSDPAYLPAVVAAIRAPQSVGALGLHILELCHDLRQKTNTMLLSDLAIAATLAHATVHASELNVLINLSLLPEKSEADRLRAEMRAMCDKADNVYNDVRKFVCDSIA
jgi:formiminotetrahydrofolate cyclodeaminase